MKTLEHPPVSLAFGLVAVLAAVNGVSKINTLPGCWEFKIDEHWTIAVNGSDKPREHQGLKTPPFSMWVFFNGWPAGLLNPLGGTFVVGTAANEDQFAMAIAKRIGEDKIPNDLLNGLRRLPGFTK